MPYSHKSELQKNEQKIGVLRASQAQETENTLWQGAGLNPRQKAMLDLQQSRGNRAVLRMLDKASPGAIQRDLAAYKTAHVEVDPNSAAEGPPIMTTTSADAPAIQTALQALITADKITIRDDGQKITFANKSASRDEIVTALNGAGYSKAGAMADALLAQHQISIYSREEVTTMAGLFGSTELGKRQQNLDVQTRRGLTNFERAEAAKVYGGSLNYDAIVLEDAPVMAIGGYARTTPWTINFPSGTLAGGGPTMTWLIHELGHSWEYARGVSIIKTLFHAVQGVYAYGGENALRAATAAGKGLNSFNTEQQADIAKDAYKAIVAGSDLSAYQPFIDEFMSGRYGLSAYTLCAQELAALQKFREEIAADCPKSANKDHTDEFLKDVDDLIAQLDAKKVRALSEDGAKQLLDKVKATHDTLDKAKHNLCQVQFD